MVRVTKDPEVRKREIVIAAMTEFYERGYDGTKIADIARRVGVAQGLCYRYFPSKEALFKAAIDEYAQRLTAPLTRLVDDTTLTFRTLLQRLPSLSDVESPDDPSYEAFHRDSSSWIHDLLSLKVCSIMVSHVAEAIRRANERGETCIEDCDVAASFAVYGQMGVLLDATLDKKERVERIQAFLHRLLDT